MKDNSTIMKGKCYNLEKKEYKDPTTGVRVTRLTDNKAFYDRPYFTTTQFSSNGRYTLFVSDFTGTSKVKNPNAPAVGKIGFGELFLLNMENGSAMQITQGEAIKMGHGAHCMISPKGDKAYFYSNEYLKEVDLRTLDVRNLIYVPFSYNFHSLSISNDCRYIVFSVVEEIPLLTAEFANPFAESAPGARERYFNGPRSLIIRYDLSLDFAECIYGGHYRITHCSLKPDDGNSILFCHDGPWHLVQRMWTVNVLTDDVLPLFVQQHNLEGVVHEFFTPSGRVGAQYSFRYKSDMDFFQFADLFIDFDGRNQERYYYKFSRPGHVSINHDETMGCGDAAAMSIDMNHPERYISLINYDKESHRAELELLCEHNTSGKKSAHVHPVFTPDDNYVIYSSDADGMLNIYMAEVDRTKTIKS